MAFDHLKLLETSILATTGPKICISVLLNRNDLHALWRIRLEKVFTEWWFGKSMLEKRFLIDRATILMIMAEGDGFILFKPDRSLYDGLLVLMARDGGVIHLTSNRGRS